MNVGRNISIKYVCNVMKCNLVYSRNISSYYVAIEYSE